MADVERKVVTTFSVKDEQSSLLSTMSGMAGSFAGGMASFGGIAAGAFGAVASGAQTALTHIIDLGSRAEQTRLRLAGMLTAFGYSGDFVGGLQLAEQAIARIETAAAALPGEAEDYLTVFNSAFANIEAHARDFLATPGQTALESMTEFSNQMTAIGVTFGQNSVVIGRQFSSILEGHATAANTLFRSLVPYLRQVQGQAGLTAKSLNAMTDEQRVRVLREGMGKLQPMLNAAAQTWDAMAGSFTTAVTQIVRGSTAPLFERAKGVLGDINNIIARNQTQIVAMGNAVSTALVGAFNDAYKASLRFAQTPMFRRLTFFAEHMGGSALRIITSDQQRSGAGTAAALAAGGPLGALVFSTVNTIVSNGALLNATINSVMTVFSQAAAFVGEFLSAFGAVSSAIGAFAGFAMPGLLDAVGNIISYFRIAFAPLFVIASDVFTFLQPAVSQLGDALGNFAREVTAFVLPVVTFFAQTMIDTWTRVRGYVMPLIDGFIVGLTALINGISSILRALRINVAPLQRPGGAAAPAFSLASFFQRAAGGGAPTPQTRRPETPPARGGHTTHNDFRNSHFTIEQKFAEGFDPDRIAVVFARDVAAMGSRRLSSGFEPLFTIP